MPQNSQRAGLPWKIIGVQLDLARQMETVDYIRTYADLAAAQGFNTLLLYLEGRIRTAHFPFGSGDQTYSLAEMEHVVDHARKLGITVVPVVPSLGHAEQFVGCPRLRHLAEERHGQGRWLDNPGKESPSTFCPSQEETYRFLERYYGELAMVFRGPWWHVGLDESWNMGYCRLCRERWRSNGLGTLFIEHLCRMREIAARLGKRMWMWDDMLQLFPEQLPNVPGDTVLCHWQYAEQIEAEGTQAHIVNHWRRNWLQDYQRRGCDVVVCPGGPLPLKNIETFTDYARRHRVLGGVLTQWAGTPRHLVGNAAPLDKPRRRTRAAGSPAANCAASD